MAEIVVRGRADFSRLNRSIAKLAGVAGIGGIGVAAAGIAKSSVQVEAAYSQSLRQVDAATAATSGQLAKLDKQAQTLGQSFGFGARESADAMVELGKAGFTADQIIGGGLKGTLFLAAAGATSLAEASTIGSNAVNSFGLKASDLNKVAIALAGAANASTASVSSLGQALSQVGPGARTAGLSLNQTVAVLSAFDNAGIKGSDAGTSLKTMLTRLVPQTVRAKTAMAKLGLDFTKADGSFVSITNVAQQLQDKLSGLTAEQRTSALATIFGSDATRAATVLAREGAKGIEKYVAATNDRSAAEKAVAANTNGSSGAMRRLAAATESAQLKIGKALAPAVIAGADALSKRLVPAAEDAIALGGRFVKAYQGDGIDAVVRLTEKLTGSQGKLTPILNEGRQAVDGLVRSFKQTAPAFLDAINGLSPLLSPLKLVGDVAGGVADVLEALPDGLLVLGIQAGIAAAVLPRLTAAASAAGGAMGTAAFRTASFAAALRATGTPAHAAAIARIGSAARSAAGIGGMLALSSASQEADDKVRVLGSTAGGALLGFSIGGPIGGAIGAGAGALLGLSQNTDKAKDSMGTAGPAAVDYASSLDELTGASTRATKAEIFKQFVTSGAISQARGLGVASRDVVNAVLGQEGALARVNTQLAKTGNLSLSYADADGKRVTQSFKTQAALDRETRALVLQGYAYSDLDISKNNVSKDQLLDFIGRETNAWRGSTKSKREEIIATQDLSKLRGQIPRSVITKIEPTGIEPTVRGIARIVRQYKLVDGKKIQALIDVTGVDTTIKDVRKVVASLNSASKTKADLSGYQRSFRGGIRDLEFVAGRGGLRVKKGVEDPIRKAKASFPGLAGSVRAGVQPAQSAARTGGYGIGTNLKGGVINGFAGVAGILAAQASSAVSGAVAAARNAAAIRSPSRKMMYVGEQMGRGLEVGMAKRKPAAKKQGRDLVRAALSGVTSGADGVAAAIERSRTLIQRQIARDLAAATRAARLDAAPGLAGKMTDKVRARRRKALDEEIKQIEKLSKARQSKILRGLRDEFTALRRNGAMQDRNTAKLSAARDRYKALVAESKAYAATIKASFVNYGSVISLGQGDGFANSTQLVDQLRARVAQAERFAKLIRKLTSAGLNKTALQDLLDAGVEGGLGTAEALAAGGSSAIYQINQLTAQLAKAGGSLGDTMSKKFKDAGIQAAAGLVAGLEKEQRRLDRAAERIGRQIVRAIKKELGIRSPSRVFRKVGEDTMAGLALGLDETYASRLGANVGRGVQRGFAKPTLTASMPGARGSAAGDTITIRFSADQQDRLSRGQELVATINYARSQGAPRISNA